MDRILLRKILSAHSKSPSESLYLELGILPITYIIKSRRLNFLHYILNRPDNDLLKKFFNIQNKYRVKNDWILTIQEDLELLGFPVNFEKIRTIKKNQFKKSIKEKVKMLAFQYLIKLKDEHTKMSNLSYDSLKIQSYFTSSKVSAKQAKSIFKFRTNMANVKENFHFMYNETNLSCPDCHQILDTQQHLLDHSDQDINQDKYFNMFRAGYHQDKVLLSRIMDQVLNRRPESS